MSAAEIVTPTTTPVVAVQRSSNKRILRLLIVPMGVVFAIGFALPLWNILSFSFEGPDGLSLEGYAEIFRSRLYLDLILRTLWLALLTTVFSALIGYPLAMAITRGPARLRGALTALVVMPLLTSVVVKTFGWSVLLSSEGVLQQALNAMGYADIKLLFTPLGVVIAQVHTFFPFMVLSLIASLAAVDRRTEEAARSLGAPPHRVFLGITLPQSLDGLAAGSALTFVTSMSALVTPQILGGGRVPTIVTVIYGQATGAQNWALASALGVVLLLITFVILSLQTWAVRRAKLN